jgi:hypothetical protein
MTLATRLGAPLLADINLLRQTGPDPGAGALNPTWAAVSRLPQADLVLYFGVALSEPLREYLAAHGTEFILCSRIPCGRMPSGTTITRR